MLVDTHAHLDYSDFDPDRVEVIKRAHTSGVSRIISIGTTIESSQRAALLADQHESVYATIGIHPCEVDSAPSDVISKLEQLSRSSKIVALGEIGIDYHHLPGKNLPPDEAEKINSNNIKLQERLFREQLDLAVKLGLNVVIHQRDSWDDVLRVLKDYTGKVRGVFHCFGGSPEQAQELLKLGHLFSFTGIVTFKNAALVQETARWAPEGSYMVETDCPYLSPIPFRGKRCEPSYTRIVAEKIAHLKGISVEEVARQSTQTAEAFFKCKETK